jgi:hypothetical protein
MLGVIVAAGIGALFWDDVSLQRAKDLVTLVLTPIVGLVGSVVGFYFGATTTQAAHETVPTVVRAMPPSVD